MIYRCIVNGRKVKLKKVYGRGLCANCAVYSILSEKSDGTSIISGIDYCPHNIKGSLICTEKDFGMFNIFSLIKENINKIEII